MTNKYEVITCEGYKFYFKYENDYPDILHIYARGLLMPSEAISVWFDGTHEIYNNERQRWQTYTKTHGIYWLWLDEKNSRILIISCFRRYVV